MSEDPRTGRLGGGGLPLTILAGLLVVALALGALLWPGSGSRAGRGAFLVFDSTGDRTRVSGIYEPLLSFLEETTGDPLDLSVVGTEAAFREKLAGEVDFVFCPDGLGLTLNGDAFVPLVVGRRAAPRNLRPRGVLVYRKAAGLVPHPWVSRPAATVCGDSVSLTATGMWRREGKAASPAPEGRLSCAWGPDPYDHAPVLHAARLGAFDYALVRQWDADRFFADGLLSPLEWGLEIMTVPVPDIVVFARRALPAKARLAVGDGLAALGRGHGEPHPAARDLQRAIAGLNLAGFNLLVDPDFDLVRRNFGRDWPHAAD